MNDSGILESLVINGDSNRSLDVCGGTRTGQLEVTENTLLSQVDIRKSVNVGADVNICGELRCDKLFHMDKTDNISAHIWRTNHLPDTQACNRKRYDLGSDLRRWENIWSRNAYSYRIDAGHVVSSSAKIGSIESSSIVTDTLESSTIIRSYASIAVIDGGIIELTKQITLLQTAESIIPVVEIQPIGIDGCELKIVALGSLTARLLDGTLVNLQKGTSLNLLNMNGIWVSYR